MNLKQQYPGVTRFTVRHYDTFDGWVDCLSGTNLSVEDAMALWNERTSNGTQEAEYRRPYGNYYDIFPANTQMVYTPGRHAS